MNPQEAFCLNMDCHARGHVGKGNIRAHSQKEKRCICDECGQTFSWRKGTLFYGLRTDPKLVVIVITLLAYGCPLKAIEKAYGFHERTIKRWWRLAGEHNRQMHAHLIGKSQLELEHVQADEIKAKSRGGSFWIAMAMMVRTRLWLGGAISQKRDLNLIQDLAKQLRQIALCRKMVLAVDGLASYVKAFRRAFRTPLKEKKSGRPRLIAWQGVAIVQVVKKRKDGRLQIERRIVQGCKDMISHLIEKTQGGSGIINTAYIERLNATFRQRLTWLGRRTRYLAKEADTLTAGMYTVGNFYNFCDYHHSLRLKLSVGRRGYRWVQRTPAMATKITDHCWSIEEVFCFKVPPPPWKPPKRRGRYSEETLEIIKIWA